MRRYGVFRWYLEGSLIMILVRVAFRFFWWIFPLGLIIAAGGWEKVEPIEWVYIVSVYFALAFWHYAHGRWM